LKHELNGTGLSPLLLIKNQRKTFLNKPQVLFPFAISGAVKDLHLFLVDFLLRGTGSIPGRLEKRYHLVINCKNQLTNLPVNEIYCR
jgi:hypothetical protein